MGLFGGPDAVTTHRLGEVERRQREIELSIIEIQRTIARMQGESTASNMSKTVDNLGVQILDLTQTVYEIVGAMRASSDKNVKEAASKIEINFDRTNTANLNTGTGTQNND